MFLYIGSAKAITARRSIDNYFCTFVHSFGFEFRIPVHYDRKTHNSFEYFNTIRILSDTVARQVKDLQHGFNSTFIVMGTSQAGKSTILGGNEKDAGLGARAMRQGNSSSVSHCGYFSFALYILGK